MTYKPSIAERIAWSSGTLSSAEIKVLVALWSAGDYETGRRCHPKVSTVVARSGLSRATVTRTLARLRDPQRPGGPRIAVTFRGHRRSTSYDIVLDGLATHAPKEQQMAIDTVIPVETVEAHNEPQREFGAQNEPQDLAFEAQNEPPTSDPDLYLENTHTTRAREDAQPELQPLVGAVPPAKCAHPHAHAWCHGRVHVPRDLHFEFLDQLGTRPGESPTQKAGRLVAFYADEMARLPADANVPDRYAFWKTAFKLWVGSPAGAQRSQPPRDEFTNRELEQARHLREHVYNGCPHQPRCTEGYAACVRAIAAHLKYGRQEQTG